MQLLAREHLLARSSRAAVFRLELGSSDTPEDGAHHRAEPGATEGGCEAGGSDERRVGVGQEHPDGEHRDHQDSAEDRSDERPPTDRFFEQDLWFVGWWHGAHAGSGCGVVRR